MNIINILLDFSVSLTYDIHECGEINPHLYASEFCNEKGISDNSIRETLKYYCCFFIKENCGWYPNEDEIQDWYNHYLNLKK